MLPSRTLLVAAILTTTPFAIAQTPEPPLPTFDIVSIKLSRPDTPPSAQFPPDGVHVTGMTLHGLLIVAYVLPGGEIIGAPAWADTTEYDLDAKVDPSDVNAYQSLTTDQRRLMRQALLADRFKLKTHLRTREGPVYALIPAKDGSKLTPTNSGDDVQCKVNIGHQQLSMQGCLMSSIVTALAQGVGRTVIDKTGLTGHYTFTLNWSTSNDPLASGDSLSLFTAIQEQLGLKFESQKGPVEDLVIDHVEMPSPN